MKRSMRQKQYYFVILFALIASCKPAQNEKDDIPPPLFSQPKTVLLNTDGGYIVNQVTGDTIPALINSKGDTIKTGVPIPALGKYIDPATVAKPNVISVGKPKVVTANTNVQTVPDKLTVIPVDESKLKKVAPVDVKSSFILLNSIGDTIPTGVPIPAKGNKVLAIQPQPVMALAPRMKYNATNDIRYLDVDQNLNSSYVKSVLEDKRGNIWISSLGGGVSRYDGTSFIHYTEKEGLTNNVVNSMLEEKSGNLWFGTDEGVTCYDGTSFTHFTEKEGFHNYAVWAISEDKNGNLWFGSIGGGVSKYDGRSFTHYTIEEGLASNIVPSILEDKYGNIWFGSWGGGLSMYNGKTFIHYRHNDELNSASYIYEDRSGNLWFGTFGQGVIRYNRGEEGGSSLTHFTEEEGLSHNRVQSILEDKSGSMWFGTNQGGINRFDGITFTHISEKEGLSHDDNWSIMEDKSGNLWVAAMGGGINRYDPKSFTHFTEQEGLSHDDIRSIFQDSKGNLWFGTWGGGVSKYDGLSFTHLVFEEVLSVFDVWAICEDKKGNLWFGTYTSGIYWYDGNKLRHYHELQDLSANRIRSIFEDKNGNMWFGTEAGGVSRFDGVTFTRFTDKEGLSGNTVWSILEDKNGNLWFGTEGGASYFNGLSFTHYTEREGLSNNSILSLFEDTKGNIWFGTQGGGVSCFDGLKFTHYTEKQGLSNNIVKSIIEDEEGNLWIGTEKGLNKFCFGTGKDSHSPDMEGNDSYLNSVAIYAYDIPDGLKDINFNTNSAIVDQSNQAWWGTGKGLVKLDLKLNSLSTKPPVVSLTQLDINDQFIDYHNLPESTAEEISFSGVENFSNYPVSLELPYNLNHLAFHFVGIDWAAPQKIQYSYRLDGFDKKWSQPSSESKVDYRNMPYGNYTFKVRAIGESQEWSEAFEYEFVIRPPWWLTWWAYGFYGLCVITGIFIVDRFQRHRLIEKERQKSREKELEQAKEIEKAYHELQATQSQLIQSEKMASLGELTAGIAHEIQNPLNFVNNFSEVSADLIEEMQEELNLGNPDVAREISEDVKTNLEKISHHGNRASGIVKGMLEHSRTGDQEKESTDLNVMIDEYLRLAYHGLRAKDSAFNAEFKIELDSSLPKINVIPQDIGRVLLNLINNAFYAVDKRAKSDNKEYKPEVIISTKKHKESIEITVKDNGPGIPAEIKDKIFQPFFTTKPTGSGTGLGLSLSYDIVKAHGGEILVDSKVNEGTEFTITIPIV